MHQLERKKSNHISFHSPDTHTKEEYVYSFSSPSASTGSCRRTASDTPVASLLTELLPHVPSLAMDSA